MNYKEKGLAEWYSVGYRPYYVENNALIAAEKASQPSGNVLLLPYEGKTYESR